jgi:hypothetical protein
MTKQTAPPDEIQKQFWKYRRVWITIIVLLIGARYILPRIPLLRGWEQKFSHAAVDLGRSPLPDNANKTGTPEEALAALNLDKPVESKVVRLNGPLFLAAWKCQPLKLAAACLRYIWKNEQLTLVVHPIRKKVTKPAGPFTKSGWGGRYVVYDGVAAALVGPFPPDEILAVWPYAQAIPDAYLEPKKQ